jgi:photosystem II stability/assembly factor-like uncharacterized protein
MSLLLLGGTKIVLSQNNFWQQTNGPYGATIRSLAINANGDIFAGTSGDGIYRSRDNGEKWFRVGLTNDKTYDHVYEIAINPATRDIFATSNKGVFRSTDNGNSWTGREFRTAV